jgi:hypothetical protein
VSVTKQPTRPQTAAEMETPFTSSSFVHRCPECEQIGKPYNLKSVVGAVILYFRCPHCHHQWSLTKDHPTDAA